VVVAAGASRRLGGSLPKPFLRIGGRTLLRHVLDSFDAARSITAVVVVAPIDLLERARRLARGARKVVAVVGGGRRRQDSVQAGLAALPRGIRTVAIHDAARPLVTAGLIDRTVASAVRHGAALAAAPIVDTVKEVVRGRVVGTLDRSRLWRAETPQACRRAWLESAFARAEQEGWEVTDDASLLEAAGRVVRVVPSDMPNFKVTTPADLDVARRLVGKVARARRSAR